MATIRMLSRSQGMYGRLLEDLEWLRDNDPYEFDAIMDELESKNFVDEVDLVLYLEGESDLMAGEIIGRKTTKRAKGGKVGGKVSRRNRKMA